MGARRLARRGVIVLVVALQLWAVVNAYGADHRVFGFQMFPEASRWRADIVRVQADGSRVDVRDGWVYRWSDLVEGNGLTNPFVEHHASAGLDHQLALLQGSLDWVAANTPDDTATRHLEATVTYTENGRGPFTLVLRSAEREAGAP